VIRLWGPCTRSPLAVKWAWNRTHYCEFTVPHWNYRTEGARIGALSESLRDACTASQAPERDELCYLEIIPSTSRVSSVRLRKNRSRSSRCSVLNDTLDARRMVDADAERAMPPKADFRLTDFAELSSGVLKNFRHTTLA
jgi:hypothetical protein